MYYSLCLCVCVHVLCIYWLFVCVCVCVYFCSVCVCVYVLCVYLLVWVCACGGQRQALGLSSITLYLYFLRTGLPLTETDLARLACQPMSFKDLIFLCSLSHMPGAGVTGVLCHMPNVLDVFWGSKPK